MTLEQKLDQIFKAYDVRGIYPETLDEEIAYRIGVAFVKYLNCKQVVIGRDMRLSSESIFKALTKGMTDQGADVFDLGLTGTEVAYYASGKLNLPGIMITASHNPKQWNGMKFFQAGAIPIGEDSGLKNIKGLAMQGNAKLAEKKGKISEYQILEDYCQHALSFIDVGSLKPLKIAIDASNGMAGKLAQELFKFVPCKVVPMNFELDGNFPNHEPNPIKNENIVDLQKKVIEVKADCGIAFDGDGDRIFFVDENGQRVSSSFISAAIIQNILQKHPNEKIVYNLICSQIVPETIKTNKGMPVIAKVGHSFIKEKIHQTSAIFGCELSAHYFYRDNYMADSGLITALLIAEMMSKKGQKLSELVKPFEKYYAIEETNTEIKDKTAKIEQIKKLYAKNLKYDFDGATFWFDIDVEGEPLNKDSWWFNVRPSNTEPVLRLNLEAGSKELMEEKTAEILKIIRS